MVEALVGAGANVRAKDKDGYTPLHWAVEIGALDIVQYLMNHGAQLTAVDNKGNQEKRGGGVLRCVCARVSGGGWLVLWFDFSKSK